MKLPSLAKLDAKWRGYQDELINAHAHTITVFYKETISGTSSSYDSYFGEGLDPNSPATMSGVTTSTGTSCVISGIAYYGQGGLSLGDVQFYHLPIGRFEPGQVIFTCRISDIEVGGTNKLAKSKYVVLSTDSERYLVQGYQKGGLSSSYVFHVILAKSNIESN